MMRKQDYIELIDKYLNRELSEQELGQLEAEMLLHEDLLDELNLHKEVEEAVREKDIIELRRRLQRIIRSQGEGSIEEMVASAEAAELYNFGLSEETALYKEFNQNLTPDELLNFESMPKMHLFQHEIAAKENIHQFYKEQQEADADEPMLAEADEAIFAEVQSALSENDVMALRSTMQKITENAPEHSFSVEDIETYMEGLMDEDMRTAFENELAVNASLANDLKLYQEINTAAIEKDVMGLRAALQEIQLADEFDNERIQRVDMFVNNELDLAGIAQFEKELVNNPSLAAEVELSRKVDIAAGEKDVIELRDKIEDILKNTDNTDNKQKRSVGKVRMRRMIVSSAVAASLVLLVGIASLVSRNTVTQPDELYQQFYNPYETAGIFRSGDANADQVLTMALQKFNSGEYEAALTMFSDIIEKDQNDAVGHFYAGMSLQEIGKYNKAIREYETVLNDRDNLFVEQAEWYIGLCYLQTDERKKAYGQLKKIAESKSFYNNQAKAIIRKWKYIE